MAWASPSTALAAAPSPVRPPSEILAHYYAGTTIGTLPSDTSIRVLVLDNFASSQAVPLTVFGRGGGWGISGDETVFPADARLRLMPPAAGAGAQWRMIVDDPTGASSLTPRRRPT